MSDRPRLELRTGPQRVFAHVLASSLAVSVANFTVWFAVTFWVYLETRSVFATGVIAGVFLVATAGTGTWFGSLVDHHRKHAVIQASAVASLVFYAMALALYLLLPEAVWRDAASPLLWVFVVVLMLGVIAGNLRGIALPTLVTLLVPEHLRDRANGLVGTTTGVSFLVTSVISGLLVAFDGMRSTILLAMVVLGGVVRAPRRGADRGAPGGHHRRRRRRRPRRRPQGHPPRGAGRARAARPDRVLLLQQLPRRRVHGADGRLRPLDGLRAGLGAAVGPAERGRHRRRAARRAHRASAPTRFACCCWSTSCCGRSASCSRCGRRSCCWPSALAVYMLLMPFAEAAEQTVLQQVVPYERQGRVFGFAQSVEQAASPLTAFLIGPITQFVVIPFMTDGAGARMIGPWFGTGPDRGIALVFVATGVIGLVATLLALASRPYRRLSAAYAELEPVT